MQKKGDMDMRRARIRRCEIAAVALLVLFLGLIVVLKAVDVQAVAVRVIGPEGEVIGQEETRIGLASVNQALLADYSPLWYKLTKYLGYAAILLAGCFALLGLYQLVTRRSLKKVDPDLLVLAGAYVLAVALYALFEFWIVNYRPVILDEGLEASFPSSHTMLILTILGTAAVQCRLRLKDETVRLGTRIAFFALMVVMAVGRLLSGVHWFTDIAGGALLGCAIVCAYAAWVDTIFMRRKARRRRRA